jgi:molybdopterin synthase sulfur carrier subunit
VNTDIPKAKVQFFGNMREVFGEKEREIELRNAPNIQELLAVLCDSYRRRQKILDQSGQIRAGVVILKNGRNIHFLDGIQTGLKGGDTIAIFPLGVGG